MNSEPIKYLGASPEAIQYHYDVDNDFYGLWLDPTRTYSCALWEGNERESDLQTAQMRKLDYHIDQAKAHGVERVLDVGCGWGSLLTRLVRQHNVRKAVGLTLSKAQQDWITSSIQDQRVEIRLENWFGHKPDEPYDAIISIAALEAFARSGFSEAEKIEAYRCFFQKCHEWLKSGGWLSLQTIFWGIALTESAHRIFVETQIFPESDLPTLAEIAKASDQLFEVVLFRNDREHYARTCRAWLSRLQANRAEACRLVGEQIVSRYEKYLKNSIIGFYTGKLNLLRATFRRLDIPPR